MHDYVSGFAIDIKGFSTIFSMSQGNLEQSVEE